MLVLIIEHGYLKLAFEDEIRERQAYYEAVVADHWGVATLLNKK